MPQMAPIGWLSLFILFSIAFMVFNIMKYYSFLPSSPKPCSSKSISQDSFIWKW